MVSTRFDLISGGDFLYYFVSYKGIIYRNDEYFIKLIIFVNKENAFIIGGIYQ
jgi:hypothetical protein